MSWAVFHFQSFQNVYQPVVAMSWYPRQSCLRRPEPLGPKEAGTACVATRLHWCFAPPLYWGNCGKNNSPKQNSGKDNSSKLKCRQPRTIQLSFSTSVFFFKWMFYLARDSTIAFALFCFFFGVSSRQQRDWHNVFVILTGRLWSEKHQCLTPVLLVSSFPVN